MSHQSQKENPGSFQALLYGPGLQAIHLIDPEGERWPANLSDSVFSISSKAPIAGDYLYQLNLVFESGDTLSEQLPLTVHHPANWNMLVLASFPSFEINYLKNFWTDKGYGFGMKLKIAQDNYFNSFVNMPTMQLDRIGSRTLDSFDFLMVDVTAWNALSNSERNVVLAAVRDDGLALIIRPDESLSRATGINHPEWIERSELEVPTSTDIITIAQYGNGPSSWKKSASPSFQYGTFQSRGLGHIFLLGIDETYQFILSDNRQIFQKIWTDIFSGMYRDFSPQTELILPEWVWAGDRTRVVVNSYKELEKNQINQDSIPLPFLELPFIKGLYEITLWPEPGYNVINLLPEGNRMSFYAHPNESWKAMRQKTTGKMDKYCSQKESTGQ